MSAAKSPKSPGQLLHFLRRTISPAVQKQYLENLRRREKLVHEFDAPSGHYEVVDMLYNGRPARLLFSGRRQAAQSGIALDNQPELLFDYNQRFMELAASLRPQSVLLIGGGAYTLPKALLAAHPRLRLIIIEPEQTFDTIAQRFFGWRPAARAQTFHTDGRAFLDTAAERYDLILIDAFSHTTIPRSLLSKPAVQAFRQHVQPSGAVAMNIISPYYGRGAELIRQQHNYYRAAFKQVDFFPASRSALSPWSSQNYVLVARQTDQPPLKLRFAAMPPPTPATTLS
ncbi:MAG TPA: fused MFS/spermidine synthase [Candidatus Saccharimonadales bacterium]|nr:fused MFS/spermidine synthase [Candidatus Saccharimonadales bacterium]